MSTQGRAFYEQLGKKLTFIRQKENMPLQTLGNILGVSHQQYIKYEKGQTRIPIDRFVTLVRFYNLPYYFFLEDIDLL